MEYIAMLDTAILTMIASLHTKLLDAVMIFFTRLGNFGFCWMVLAVVLLCFRPTRRTGAAIAIAMVLCYVVGNLTIKPIVARPRPYVLEPGLRVLIMPNDPYSFPSGHTMHSFAATTALASSYRRRAAPALLGAILISFSRLYLMVHYPSDVFGGVVLGVTAGVIGHELAERFVPLRRA